MERVARSTLATAAVIATTILALLVPGGAARADHVGQQLLSVETPDGLDDFPVVSPDGEWVIFPANRDGVYDLWIVPTGTPGATPVRVNPAGAADNVYFHGFSPDSQYIVYGGRYDPDDPTITVLYSRPTDLSAPATRLSEHAASNTRVLYDFVVSPDSSRVVYSGDLTVAGQDDLYSRPIDGSGPQVRLTSEPVAGGEVATASTEVTPDSARVVFRGELDAVGVRELYSAPIDQAGGQVKLNDTPVPDGNVSSYEIAGDSSRVVYLGDLDVDQRFELHSAPIDQADEQVTLSVDPAGGGVSDFLLTPAGDEAIYFGDLDAVNRHELYRRATDGSTAQARLNDDLPSGDADVGPSPAISPDGTRVAYRIKPGNALEYTLYSRQLAPGSPQVRVSSTANPGNSVERVDFTHSGDHLVYSGPLLTDGAQLYSRPADGSGTEVQLTAATTGNVTQFLVAPDDTRIVYRGDIVEAGKQELFSAPLRASGEQVPVSTSATPDGDVDPVALLPDSSAVVYVGNLGADSLVDHLWISDGGQLPPVAPGTPTVTSVSGNTVDLAWNAPPASQVDEYTVTAVPEAAGAVARLQPRQAAAAETVTGTTSGTSMTLTGLEPLTTYTVTVRADNHVGPGGTSSAVEFTTLTADGVQRLFGTDRFETAVQVALDRFDPADVDTVYLAVGTNFPDALAGGPLAAQHQAPILLVRTDVLPDAVAEALATLAPDTIVAFGGTAAVSDAVLAAAASAAGDGVATDRIFGTDRYETAAEIAAAMHPSGFDTAFLATGVNFPDALAGGPATGGAPILLSAASGLPPATAEALAELAADEVVALGGTAAVPEATLDAAAAAAGPDASTNRLFGTDRFQTAVAIADTLGEVDTVYVAVGTNFPDALSAGPAATLEGAPIVLVRTDVLPDTTADHLDALTGLRRIVILGGSGAVSDDVATQLAALLD